MNNSVPYRKKNSKQENQAFESPDGVLIQINRGGNKMQFIRDLCRTKEITHVQFRMLVPLVDMSNEGTHDNPELWGKAWMKVDTLAYESGCSERAIQDNMPLLEAAGIVKVKRDLTNDGRPKGGRSNYNEYWLDGWNKFGAVSEDHEKGAHRAPFSESEKGARGSGKGAACSGKGARGSKKGAHGAPDSTYLLNPEPNQYTPPAAPRREGPADLDGNDECSISTSDRMSKYEQFAFVSQFYQRKLNRPATNKDWDAFNTSYDRVGFDLILTNIGLAGPEHSFVDCVSAKIYSPPPGEYDPDEWDGGGGDEPEVHQQAADGDLNEGIEAPF